MFCQVARPPPARARSSTTSNKPPSSKVAYWFRNRDTSGLIRHWPHDGTYQVFAQLELLREVRGVLKKYERFLL